MKNLFKIALLILLFFAVLSELGRFPLHFNVIKAMIRYYDRLQKIEEMFPLLHAAYK
jgi:hypothetical protein